MFTLYSNGKKQAEIYLSKLGSLRIKSIMDSYGRLGVDALSKATPMDSGETASSWSYTIDERGNGSYKLNFLNSHINNGIPIAILIQYGHATKNGGYVEGFDFINPALQVIFDKMANDIWLKVVGV